MARMRVHELAKELNVNNKELIERILKLGIQVKNHMSTLTDSAVIKVRQQFGDARPEDVEEKRIGRQVIRRRKKASDEPEEIAVQQEQPPVIEKAPPAEPQITEIPSFVSPPEEREIPPLEEQRVAEAPSELPQVPQEPAVVSSTAAEIEAEVEAAELLAPPEPSPLPETIVPEVAETPVEKVIPVHDIESLPSEEGIPSEAKEEVAQEPEKVGLDEGLEISLETGMAQEAEIVQEVEELPGVPEEAVTPAQPEPEVEEEKVSEEAEETVQESVSQQKKEAQPLLAEVAKTEIPTEAEVVQEPEKVEQPEPLPEPEKIEEAERAEEAEEEEAQSKPKKTKKRRRKKARKDEPARIIKLPEIIPEEPEEETELPSVVSRLGIKPDEELPREPSRRKRPRLDTSEREMPDGKRRARRKEVLGKEDLYTPGQLAAQADRKSGGAKERPYAPKEDQKPESLIPKVGKRKIKIDEAITVANLARQMGIKAGEVIKKLLLLGLPANINQAIDFDTAALLATDFDFEVERVGFEEEGILQVQEDIEEDRILRPPVITVMGHVDHGKTSLLDAIRDTNVIKGEAGGITQHIGAYYVKFKSGEVVFLDTPGHEAFTAMRARGAKVTDLVILVVAADDGVMQQTIEAINHAKAAQVPIIVAINKIDKPNANVDRVKRELSEHGLLPEEWGGNVTMVEVSAKKRINIDELLEMALLQAELLELKANPDKPARGRVIEAKLDKGRGAVATILIQEGTLRTGDVYVCGLNYGRVRNMFNDLGQQMDQAGPSMPVEVSGFSGVPSAGDDFVVLPDEKQAKMVAEHRLHKQREKELSRTSKVTLESLFEQIQEGEIKELDVILKTDVHGSLEAISEALNKLSTSSVKVNLIHSGTGAITETDVMLASASNAIVIGFNVRADAKVHELAHQEQVDIRYYDVIYQIISDIKDAMVGMLEPVYKENVIGHVEVRQTFHVPKIGMIAGCYVVDGRVERGAKIRVLRDQVVIYDGKIASLRRFKEDAKEVKAGFECGIGIENFNDVKVNDILEVYELQEIQPVLETETDKNS